jgi:hypothetical protein
MENSEKAIELLKSLHNWFMESAPEQYNGCGLWIDVDAFLAREGNRPVDRVVIRNPEAQIRAWINNSHEQVEFWQRIQRSELVNVMGKTPEQVDALVNYFEGKFDMACNIRDFVSQKTISE